LKMSVEEAQAEVHRAWTRSYSPERTKSALDAIADKPFDHRVMHLVSRLTFRGIYFPQMGKRAWAKVIFANRRPIIKLAREAFSKWRRVKRAPTTTNPRELVGTEFATPMRGNARN
jgi:hypothetical protein